MIILIVVIFDILGQNVYLKVIYKDDLNQMIEKKYTIIIIINNKIS